MDLEALQQIEDGDLDNRASFKIYFIISRVASILNSIINGLQRSEIFTLKPISCQEKSRHWILYFVADE
ncbi:hypothetical protein BKM20_05790 [Pseudomonas avellanae]|uniref:Uncharacterized protein n=2 Tax=Pseudomonas avellanae TaxID=46257 RepID=A0AAD0GSM8_9PSED|nr:hypothetical protein BKM03_27430 [Pseudomonas avellanae]EGH08178.1 hypothetical protein PSYMP_05729 [Pseudomonas amygdali pv. morsprunorum str. M302280]KWS59432.1 hypothetical protein AL055_03080 [Pseudomonas amygdali pv. morsprunorum]PHN45133.1 hypothetical protein AO261_06095 [Pseudomonas avellanae]POC97214.1 hypothetical protein BKM26_04500 [Pseudomonas avellanae]